MYVGIRTPLRFINFKFYIDDYSLKQADFPIGLHTGSVSPRSIHSVACVWMDAYYEGHVYYMGSTLTHHLLITNIHLNKRT